MLSVEAYGCTMNSGEARLAMEMLEDMGYSVIEGSVGPSSYDPDGVIIFTCDVIDTTERRMFRRMEEIHASGKKLYVAGCLARIDPSSIKRRFPDAVILNTMGVENLRSSIRKAFPRHRGQETGLTPSNRMSRVDHIVPIATGCTGACTYCITRRARGGHSSRTPGDIGESILQGSGRGKKEILLASQDTGSWGADLGPEMDLPYLLNTILPDSPDDIRIRIGMMNPRHLEAIFRDLMDIMERDKRLFRFLHLPVQSGSDRLLEMMGREYSSDDFIRSIDRIRQRHPRITISTDIITGFPSETDEDHRLSMELLGRIRPDVLNITRYSRRKNTPADSFEGQVPGRISKERSREITLLHHEMTGERLKERSGFHENCLITEVGRDETMMARDMNYTPIVVKGEKDILGSFRDIITTDTGPAYLIGHVL